MGFDFQRAEWKSELEPEIEYTEPVEEVMQDRG